MPRKKSAADKVATLVKTLAKSHDKAELIKALRLALADLDIPKQAYDEEVAKEICNRMALGETLMNIVKDDHIPNERGVYYWRKDNPDFAQRYARARVDQMHAWSDQIITLADDCEGGFSKIRVPLDSKALKRIEADGDVIFSYERRHVTEAAIQIDTRKWLMARVAPEDFGDKSTVNLVQQYEGKDDSELLETLRQELEKAGITPDDMVGIMTGEIRVQ